MIDPLLLLGQTPLAVLSFVRLTGGLKQIDPSPGKGIDNALCAKFLSKPFGEKVSFEVVNSWVLSHHQHPPPQVRPKLFQRLGTGQGGALGPCSDDQGRKSDDKMKYIR